MTRDPRFRKSATHRHLPLCAVRSGVGRIVRRGLHRRCPVMVSRRRAESQEEQQQASRGGLPRCAARAGGWACSGGDPPRPGYVESKAGASTALSAEGAASPACSSRSALAAPVGRRSAPLAASLPSRSSPYSRVQTRASVPDYDAVIALALHLGLRRGEIHCCVCGAVRATTTSTSSSATGVLATTGACRTPGARDVLRG